LRGEGTAHEPVGRGLAPAENKRLLQISRKRIFVGATIGRPPKTNDYRERYGARETNGMRERLPFGGKVVAERLTDE